jgi:uncharacterized membrane protein
VGQSINRRAIRWLRGELPELVSGGVITSENAAAIDRHYQTAEEGAPNIGFVILAAIGTTLVSAGIILLVAHNWDELSRFVRCVIAFLPLVIAQLLGLFVLLRRNDSAAWRESVAIFDIAAIGTAISLVSQVFQIQGSFPDFVRVWLLLSIPIVYLFRSRVGALAYIIGCGVWVLTKLDSNHSRPGETFFWLLLLFVAPFYISVVRQGIGTWSARVLSTALVIVAALGVGAVSHFARTDMWMVSFTGYFAAIYRAGMLQQEEGHESLNTLAVLGGLGIAGMAIILSFEEFWHLTTWNEPLVFSAEQRLAIGIQFLFPVVAIALAGWGLVARSLSYSWTAVVSPIVAIIARLIAGMASNLDRSVDNQYASSASILFNVFALILGLEFLVRGIRAGSMTRANFGLLVIAALAMARFFDSDLSFVARGVGFIAVGAGFLIANLVFFRRRARS